MKRKQRTVVVITWITFPTRNLRVTVQFLFKKNAFYLSVKVCSTKVIIGDTIFTSPCGDGTATLSIHRSHAKFQPFAGQKKHLHSSAIVRPWVLVRSRESNRRPPALQVSALPTELILRRLSDMHLNRIQTRGWGLEPPSRKKLNNFESI